MSSGDDGSWEAWFDSDAWARWIGGGADAGWGPWLADLAGWRGPTPALPTIADPDAAAAAARDRSLADGASPDAAERLVRHAAGRTRWSIVFLHGFGATRAGGEAVIDLIAAEASANTFYPLLPGHGRNPEAHATAPAEDYLKAAAHALAMGQALGHRVLLVGSSTGGLLATWLAATWPDAVQGVVLASPFFAFADPTTLVFRLPFGMDAVERTYGPVRDASFGEDPESRRVEGYEAHWLTEQRYRALAHLDRLRGWIAREAVYSRVQCPVLLIYSPRDAVVDLDAMHRAFARMGPHALSRFQPIEDGHHVLLSAYVRTDKDRIAAEIRSFLTDVSAG
jgi:pimeloyl-ACP methyl ester carboxylesterase